MKPIIGVSVVVLGITAVTGQVVLLRELTTSLYGNEVFIGWILFSWLFWVAVGALAGQSAAFSRVSAGYVLAGCHIFIAPLLPIAVVLARLAGRATGPVAGAAPALGPALAFSFFTPALACPILGIHFVAAARILAGVGSNGRPKAAGTAYALENAGFVIGGVLFSFLLVTAHEYAVVALLGLLNAVVAAAVMSRLRIRSVPGRLLPPLVVSLMCALFLLRTPLGNRTAGLRFPLQTIVESRSSRYGNVSVTKLGEQFNYYAGGVFLGSDHDETSEPLGHIPLLLHPEPRSILLIGGGFTGVLTEMLKHDPERIDYCELDPGLMRTIAPCLPPQHRLAIEDSRVNVVHLDGRYFLATTARLYDVIIVNLPRPSTLLINRCFTREFFKQARARLSPGGVFAFQAPFSPDYVSREMENLCASLHRALADGFESVVLLPDYSLLFVASNAELLPDPASLMQRFRDRRLTASLVTPEYLEYRFSTDRIETTTSLLASNTLVSPNSDARPSACHYSMVEWMSSFHPPLARAAALLDSAGAKAALAAAALFAMASFFIRGHDRRPSGAMTIASFSLMTVEVVIILSFQTLQGSLYHMIGLIIAALMCGMTGGAWATLRWTRSPRQTTLARLHGAIALHAAILLGALSFLSRASAATRSALVTPVLLAMAAAIGFLVGFEFPVANRLHLSGRRNPGKRLSSIYAADLAGSCCGALLTGIWMLPVLGVAPSLASIVAVNALAALILGVALRTPAR